MGDVTSPAQARPSALVLDWGGVLTVPLADAFGAWARTEGVAPEHWADVLRSWRTLELAESGSGPGAGPVAQLERGEIAVADFEALVAGELATRGSPVSEAGVLGRMLAGLDEPEPRMFELVAAARTAGLATALLSNSWGNTYDRTGWAELFDTVVISGEVGMRKPEARIFELTAKRLGVAMAACVLVDDLPWNVEGARAAGMAAVLHVDVETTRTELERLVGVPLVCVHPQAGGS